MNTNCDQLISCFALSVNIVSFKEKTYVVSDSLESYQKMKNSKLPIKLLIPIIRSLFFLSKDNQIVGLAGKQVRMHYFVFDAFNWTGIPIEIGYQKECARPDCDAVISAYQTGKIDYFLSPTILPHIYPNTTIGPIEEYLSCFMWSKSVKKLKLTSHDFVGTFSDISSNILFLLLFVAVLNIILLSWFNRMNFLKVTMYVYALIFSESFGFNRLVGSNCKTKILAIKLVIFLFLIRTIFLCYIKTGMISDPGHVKVDSFEDVVTRQLTPYTISYSHCKTSLKRSSFNLDQAIYSKIRIFSPTSDFYKTINDQHFLLIAETNIAFFFQTYLCITRDDSMEDFKYYKSNYVTGGPKTALISKHTPELVEKRLKEVIYSNFESGCHTRYSQLLSQMMEYLFGSKPAASCIANLVSESDGYVLVSIPLTYFKTLALVFLIVIVTSLNIFVSELFLFNDTKLTSN